MKTLEQRFWSKVDKGAKNECWNWTAYAPADTGYGRITVDNESCDAHRVSWKIHKGKIPKRKWVLHRCDNRLCVNPNHLFLGRAKDNTADMMSKGLHRTNPCNPAKGETNGSAKLTESKVIKIRQEYAHDNISQRALAARFKVSQGTIGYIVRNEIWTHI